MWYCQVPDSTIPLKLADPDRSDPAQHRSRLLEGMAEAVAAKGYADTTIADIVGAAGVSRRTFYEQFATKAECFIALYEAASHNALAVLRGAIDRGHPWQTQVEQALAAYLAGMAQNPALLRTLFIEILGLGAEGLAARRRVNQEICSFMLEVVNGAGKRKTPFTREMAVAVVGGINELVLQAIEQGKVDRLAELAAPAGQLVRAVTQAGS
ncbi:MAG: transcriptional regulator, TetR family-like protein [Ramlibacter sp.]|jgi:AcrR family transcriptional regulator|nr:transcriptional regulator, TetR family-like protein [Ramlibacter sp.]